MKAHRVVAALGALGTVVFAGIASHAHGVYTSDAQVRFIAPTSSVDPNTWQLSASSLVMVAGAVGQMVDDSQAPRATSPKVTITGMGVRDGWSVTLPNTGGQWGDNFVSPYLDIQVAGPSAAVVSATMQTLIRRIDHDLSVLQQRERVAPGNLIHTQVNSLASPPIYYERGSRVRALLAAFALGIGFSVALTMLTRRFLLHRASSDLPQPELVEPDSTHPGRHRSLTTILRPQ